MKLAIASDHAGFEYKEKLKQHLAEKGHEAVDFGTDSGDNTDYPCYIHPAAEAVARGECERGIVLGGSGNGEAITANRLPGIRCTLCWNNDSARLARYHNNSNMLSMGARLIDFATAERIVDIWLETPFKGGCHKRRIDLIDNVKERSEPCSQPDRL